MGKLQPGIIASFSDSILDRLREMVSKLTALITATTALAPASAAFGSVQTANPGSEWTALSSASAKSVTVLNETGTDIEARLNAAGTSITISDNQGLEIGGLTNANQIGVRRVDLSNTQVTLKYMVS